MTATYIETAGLLLVALSIGASPRPLHPPLERTQRDAAVTSEPVYIVYYWRARPGKATAYAQYIQQVAEPIDAEAQKAGVFDEVRTYTPAIATGAPGGDWTHVRVFRLKNFAALDVFSRGLEEAAARVFPDEAVRREQLGRSADLRDLVRQEIWRDFR